MHQSCLEGPMMTVGGAPALAHHHTGAGLGNRLMGQEGCGRASQCTGSHSCRIMLPAIQDSEDTWLGTTEAGWARGSPARQT